MIHILTIGPSSSFSLVGGPLGRSPLGGRNFEGWSPDEYLTGVCSFLTVKHAQKNGLMTCAKHFIGYEVRRDILEHLSLLIHSTLSLLSLLSSPARNL